MVPLVSIIIPNFNRAYLISETLESIIAQSHSNWEALVIDDGSTDNSLEVVKGFVASDARISLIERNREPKGATTCRNIGIQKSRSKYIIFLDSDDLLAPLCLEQRLNVMLKNPSISFGVFPIIIFNQAMGDSSVLWNEFKSGNDLERFINLDLPWATPSAIWKKEALLSINGWSEDIFNWQDWDLHLRAIISGLPYIKNESLPDCFVRRSDKVSRISGHKPSVIQIKSRIKLFAKNYNLLQLKGLVNNKTKEVFAGHFLLLTEQIILYRLPIDEREAYNYIVNYQLLNNASIGVLKIYLQLFHFFTKNNLLLFRSILYKFIRLFLPGSMVRRKSTHLKLHLDEASMKEMLSWLQEGKISIKKTNY